MIWYVALLLPKFKYPNGSHTQKTAMKFSLWFHLLRLGGSFKSSMNNMRSFCFLKWTTWQQPYQPKHCTCTTSHPFSWGISRQCCSSPFPFKTVKVARLMPGVRRKRTWIASRVQQRRLRGKKGSIANCSRMVDFPALSLGSRSKWNPKQ